MPVAPSTILVGSRFLGKPLALGIGAVPWGVGTVTVPSASRTT